MTYLHLGEDTIVPAESVVAVCDLDNASASHITRAFLKRAQREGRVVNVTEELPRSFVLCREEDGGDRVYLSLLNSATLMRRLESLNLE